MKLKHFKKGKTFWMSGQKYLCTDVGSRVATAICIDEGDGCIEIETHWEDGQEEKNRVNAKKEGWLNGPPYKLLEIVIDEYNQDVCFLRKPKE